MDRFVITGPTALIGRVRGSGAKNAALPALAASLLTDEPVTLHHVPKVRDLRTMRRLLDCLGVGSEEREAREPEEPKAQEPEGPATVREGALVLQRTRPSSFTDAPYELGKTMGASGLVLGP